VIFARASNSRRAGRREASSFVSGRGGESEQRLDRGLVGPVGLDRRRNKAGSCASGVGGLSGQIRSTTARPPRTRAKVGILGCEPIRPRTGGLGVKREKPASEPVARPQGSAGHRASLTVVATGTRATRREIVPSAAQLSGRRDVVRTNRVARSRRRFAGSSSSFHKAPVSGSAASGSVGGVDGARREQRLLAKHTGSRLQMRCSAGLSAGDWLLALSGGRD
jgi:hypothetical protein